MSDNNNVLIAAVAIGAYFYIKRGQMGGAPKTPYQGQVPSMPGSAGVGTNQVASGALVGFLQAISGSLRQPPSIPISQPQNNFVAQENAEWTMPYWDMGSGDQGGSTVDNIMY